MADQQIDELYLDIGVDVDKNIDKRISSLASAINELNTAVANVGNLERYVKALGKISLKGVGAVGRTGVARVQQSESSNLLQTTEAPDDSSSIQQSYINIEKYNGALKVAIATQKQFAQSLGASFERATQQISQSEVSTKNFNKELEKVRSKRKGLRDLGRETKNAGKEAKRSTGFFSKFIKSIGRIALYRAIRTSLSQIAKLAKEGFQNFVKFDEETNKSMSNVKNSLTQVGDSLGITLGNTLKLLEPVITSVLNGLNQIIEDLNVAMAVISGKNTYTSAIKQNEDYIKSLEKTKSTLLSFDKFEALNQGNDEIAPEDRFGEIKVPEELTKTQKMFKGTIEGITNVIKGIKKAVEWMDELKIAGDFSALDLALWGIVGVLGVIVAEQILVMLTNPWGWIVAGILATAVAIGLVVKYWDDIVDFFNKTCKKIATFFSNLWTTIVNGCKWFVNKVIDMINLMLEYSINPVIEFFGGEGLKINHIQYSEGGWGEFADGGTFKKGTRFIAGEAGAEIVYNNRSGGGGGVANIEQIAEAQYRGTIRALMDYGVARGDFDLNGMAVEIDGTRAGRVVAKSVGAELTRVGYFNK